MGILSDNIMAGASVSKADPSIAYTHTAVDTTNKSGGGTYTFTSVAIGTAATDRLVVVGAMTGAGDVQTITGITIGGNAATIVKNQTGGDNAEASIGTYNLASGTTTTVVVTFADNPSGCGIGVWAIYDANHTVSDTGGAADSSTLSDSLTVPAGGVVIAVVAQGGNPATVTWTDPGTENFDALIDAGLCHSGASEVYADAQAPLTVSCAPSTSDYNCMACATWGP